jgi:hypothetical protein
VAFERPTAGTGPAAEPAPTPVPPDTPEGAEGTPLALQLQVLSTEHWSLLASRSLAWNESFSRAGMFLSALSGAIVALALVAQATAFGEGFRIFALVILPVVLFIGLTTLVRLGIANYHDALTVIGMNRIRAAYFERVPEVQRYFVMPGTDDDDAAWRAMGMDPAMPIPLTLMASAPTVIGVVNAVIAASIAAIAALQFGTDTAGALIAGAIGFVVMFAIQVGFGAREALRQRPDFAPMFPAEPEDPAAPST